MLYSRFWNVVSTSNSRFIVDLAKTRVKTTKISLNPEYATTIGNPQNNHWLIAEFAARGRFQPPGCPWINRASFQFDTY